MAAFAFKHAARAAQLEGGAGALFSLAIAEKTGSPYSHVECYLDGPLTAARCFSSREPDGTGWATLDLSDSTLWTIVDLGPLTPEQLRDIEYFCRGSEDRKYDGEGILGIDLETAWHDPGDRFCSEMGFDIGQRCLGWRTDIPRWMVAPGWKKGGCKVFGLYELITEGKLFG